VQSYVGGAAGAIDRFIHGSFLHGVIHLFGCCSSYSKRARFNRLVDRVDTEIEQALDVRTILRMQSLLIAITRVIFEPNNLPLLKL